MSLSISVHVYDKLSASTELAKLVGDNIFPVSTLRETTFPFVLYTRGSLVPNSTKDRYDVSDNIEVEVVVADNDYARSVDVAELVRSLLDRKKGQYERFSVTEAKLLSADETFSEDTFIQRLIFSFETEPNT